MVLRLFGLKKKEKPEHELGTPGHDPDAANPPAPGTAAAAPVVAAVKRHKEPKPAKAAKKVKPAEKGTASKPKVAKKAKPARKKR